MRSFEQIIRDHLGEVATLRNRDAYFVDYMMRTKSVFEEALAVIGKDESPAAERVRERLYKYLNEIDGTPHSEVTVMFHDPLPRP